MTPDEQKQFKRDLTEGMSAAVEKGLKNAIGDLYIDRQEHFEDHQFVGGVRGGIRTVRKGGLMALGASVLGGIIYVLQSWLRGGAPPTP